MKHTIEELFAKTTYASPEAYVAEKVLVHIRKSVLRRARARTVFFGATATISFAAFIPATIFFLGEIARSSFGAYLSLVFTDSGTLIASWHEFGLALVESAPIMGIMFILGIAFVFLISLRALSKYAGNFFILKNRFAS